MIWHIVILQWWCPRQLAPVRVCSSQLIQYMSKTYHGLVSKSHGPRHHYSKWHFGRGFALGCQDLGLGTQHAAIVYRRATSTGVYSDIHFYCTMHMLCIYIHTQALTPGGTDQSTRQPHLTAPWSLCLLCQARAGAGAGRFGFAYRQLARVCRRGRIPQIQRRRPIAPLPFSETN